MLKVALFFRKQHYNNSNLFAKLGNIARQNNLCKLTVNTIARTNFSLTF